MTYLLDTNVVSEWVKPRPNRGLVTWLAEVDEDRTYLSVLTLGELRRGIDRLSPSKRRERLETWVAEELADRFEGRTLSIGPEVADEWGRLAARMDAAGTPVGAVDGLIAATAAHHDLGVVTRNVAHFEPTGVRVVNPWTSDTHDSGHTDLAE